MDQPETPKLHIFLCHASQDKPVVRDVYKQLATEGWIDPWLDEENLLPGQDWDTEIEVAVEASDAVIVFLSTTSVTKEGYIQHELKFALDIALDKPETSIFIIPVRLDDCYPPRRLRNLQYVDYFPASSLNTKYQQLRKSLQIRYEQKYGTKHPDYLKVAPSDERVYQQTWSGVSVPSSYVYVGKIGTPAVPHFYRPRDQHLAVLYTDTILKTGSFLIDKYAVTCQQYCDFLNELGSRDLIQTTIKDGEHFAVREGQTLVVDALDHWKRLGPRKPWLHAPKPFGITSENSVWTPLPGSDLLPATLVTWWGARAYSFWVHNTLHQSFPASFAFLPSSAQWLAAALWDSITHSRRHYPWGDSWNSQLVNYSGYWAGRDIITEGEWELYWENNPQVYATTRPLPVAELPQNISPAGCVQMLGNVWEWTLTTSKARTLIHGGCATSPLEHCELTRETSWPNDKPYEYLGFRCCYSLQRFI